MRTDYNAFELAQLADVASPDSKESKGADFLLSVQDRVNDALSYGMAEQGYELSDVASEIGDESVPVYTHEKWQTFVDLCAYTEDVTEFGPIQDLDNASNIALFLIAERLATVLLGEDGGDDADQS